LSIDPNLFLPFLAIFAAATLQSATGVGFGIIAGPILLAFLDDASAIQISIVLNLLIAVLLAPSVWSAFDRRIMSGLLTGVAIGSILGFALFVFLALVYLKFLAGLFVLASLVMLLFGSRLMTRKQQEAPTKDEQIGVGFFGGVMGASLAMPGPVPAAWMSMIGLDKNTIRATILTMFLFAYSVALLLQVIMVGFSPDTMQHCLEYAGPTVAGILVGRYLSTRISERVFHYSLVVFLVITSVALFSSIIG
jgi:uncharacterized membrane protein YfcA|tara:strand:- start:652 stop:1401 length:750 start_codon:yes stop_codon:yes gene_type:complete